MVVGTVISNNIEKGYSCVAIPGHRGNYIIREETSVKVSESKGFPQFDGKCILRGPEISDQVRIVIGLNHLDIPCVTAWTYEEFWVAATKRAHTQHVQAHASAPQTRETESSQKPTKAIKVDYAQNEIVSTLTFEETKIVEPQNDPALGAQRKGIEAMKRLRNKRALSTSQTALA